MTNTEKAFSKVNGYWIIRDDTSAFNFLTTFFKFVHIDFIRSCVNIC